jgi:PAS domain S-box-containing protein
MSGSQGLDCVVHMDPESVQGREQRQTETVTSGFSGGDHSTARSAADNAHDGTESLRAIFDTAGIGLAKVDAATSRFLQVNAAYCVITGLSETQLLGLTIRDLHHPDDRGFDEDHFIRMARGEVDSFDGDEQYLRPDGSVVWVHVHAKPVRDNTGRVVHMVAVIQDVTEQKRVEEAMLASEERLRLATWSAGIGVFDYDTAAKRTLWSPELCALVGVPMGTITSLSEVLGLVYPEDRDRFIEGVTQTNDPQGDGKVSDEFRICRADTGEVRWLAKSCQTFFEGTGDNRRAIRTIGVMVDITERKVREGHDKFLSDLSSAWIPVRDVPTLVETTADALARHLNVDGVTFADITPDDLLTAAAQADLIAGRILVVNDVMADPRTAFAPERYLHSGVRAMIIVPLRGGRGVRSALCVNTTGPRAWRPDEMRLLERLAARLWPNVERARAEDALRQSEERLEFLLKLSDALRPLNDPVAMQETAARLLAEHLKVNRVIYSDIEGTNFIVRVAYEKGVAPVVRSGQIGSYGQALLDEYRRGDTVHVNDVRTDARFTEGERANLLASEIVSFIRAMLMKGGQWVTALGVHCATPRVWTQAQIALFRDVAERIWEAVERAQAMAAWRSTEARFRAFLENSPTIAWLKDEEGHHVYLSPTFERRFGVRLEDCRGKTVFDLWPRAAAEQFFQNDRAVLASDQPLEVLESAPNPDGTVSWWLSNKFSFRDPSGRRFIGGIGLDVTDRKRDEEALQARRDEEHNRTLQLLLETAAQGILSVDAQGVILTANRALEAMFGWAPGELVGRSVEQLLPHTLREPHAAHRAAYFSDPSPRPMGVGMDLLGQRKDGSRFPIEISLNQVPSPTGGYAIAFVTDITPRKQAEEALRQSHAALQERTAELERRTVQLSRLASDLTLAEQHAREQLARTLHDGLQQLLFSASVKLDRQFKRDEQQGNVSSELLAQARVNIDAAIAASRSLSVELFPPALHAVGLPGAVNWLADWVREKYGLTVQATVDPRANSNRKEVRTLLFESLRELLFNAVKHARVDRVTVELALSSNDTIRVTVADQGIGFDATAFMNQTERRNVGLGLFSIRERLLLLGGQFGVESAPGRGTRFYLVAPRGDETTAGAQVSFGLKIDDPGAAVRPAPSEPLRILIVDDHAGVREALREMFLDRPEFHVAGEAINGLEAIAEARALQPDVIIMDISMPEMDGVEATRRIHVELPSILIFGLAAQERSEHLHAIEQAGGAGYFIKGVETHLLLDRLHSVHAVKESRAQASAGAIADCLQREVGRK